MKRTLVLSMKAVAFLNTSYREYKLSTRLRRVLFLYGESWGEILKSCSREDLLQLRNFGPKTLKELQDLLDRHGCGHLLN